MSASGLGQRPRKRAFQFGPVSTRPQNQARNGPRPLRRIPLIFPPRDYGTVPGVVGHTQPIIEAGMGLQTTVCLLALIVNHGFRSLFNFKF